MLHVTSNLFPTFFHTQEGRSAIHDVLLPHLLRCSQQFQHTGTHSIILWPDWEESSPVLWLHFHCFPCWFILDSTHLKGKDWGKIGLLLSIICLQLMAVTIPGLTSANSYLNQSLTEIWQALESLPGPANKGSQLLTGTDTRKNRQITTWWLLWISVLLKACSLLIPAAK